MKKSIIIFCFSILLFSCSKKINPAVKKLDKNAYTGIYVIDAETFEVKFAKNADKLFIPASNIKILTLYAGLNNIGAKLPGLKYQEINDSLKIMGTADPSFLHPDFSNTVVFDFLKKNKAKHIVFSDTNFQEKYFGPGWAWDDYNDYYSPELSAMPIYGNVVRAQVKAGKLEISPKYFTNKLNFNKNTNKNITRNENENEFEADKSILNSNKFKQEIPFKTSSALLVDLLSDTLKRKVTLGNFNINDNFKTLVGTPKDTVLRKMMLESDNLLAEHTLLMAGLKYSDTISGAKAIKGILADLYPNMPQKPVWVDGSGLSRYNLFSPQDMAYVLQLIKLKYGMDEIKYYFTANGREGKLKLNETPIIYSKSGSMGGVYNQSGYIICKSGKVLIFSCMNNNFNAPVLDYRKMVFEYLVTVWEEN